MAADEEPVPVIDNVAANLDKVNLAIAEALQIAGRAPGGAALVAVSKTQPPTSIMAAIDSGQRLFGENRVQEALSKWPDLKAGCADVKLHLIGPLQTNKVSDAVALFDVIETVDRPKLARALAQEMKKQDRILDCFIQVNTGEETQKAGVLPEDSDAFISLVREELELPLRGLMCIPPLDEECSLHFALLRQIAQRNDLAELSMGMSADYEVAIQFGATMVRVGTSIFGPRKPYS